MAADNLTYNQVRGHDSLPGWFYIETAFFDDQVSFYPLESLVNSMKSSFPRQIHMEKPFDPTANEPATKSVLALETFFDPSPVSSRSLSPWSEGTIRSFASSPTSTLSSIESTKLKRQDLIKKPSSLSIASCSLINIQNNMKLYRRLASKTQHETQITYAHYLLQIANLYSSPNLTRTRLLKEAGYWINRLSNKNHPEAVYQEGLWYLHGSDVPGYESIKINKAKKNFQKASKKGYLAAHYQLAQLLEPSKKVIKLYDKGVKENHTPSVIRMAEIYLYGEFNQKDIKLGVEYLTMAAATDNRICAEPCFMLSCIYGNEPERVGLPSNNSFSVVNYQLSLSYLKKAAQYEHPEAIYSLGRIHELGLLDQPQDLWKAYQYYAEASDLQYPIAMLNLAKQYQAGIPGHLSSQNDLAFKWCKRAADLGYDQAEYTLGKYYEQGIGVTKNVQFAFEYFGKAASSNHRLASEKLNRHLGHPEKQTQHINNVTEKKKKVISMFYGNAN